MIFKELITDLIAKGLGEFLSSHRQLDYMKESGSVWTGDSDGQFAHGFERGILLLTGVRFDVARGNHRDEHGRVGQRSLDRGPEELVSAEAGIAPETGGPSGEHGQPMLEVLGEIANPRALPYSVGLVVDMGVADKDVIFECAHDSHDEQSI